MSALTTEQCIKQCASQAFICANITHSTKTREMGLFEVTPFTADWVALDIVPNQLIIGIFFFAWNAAIFPFCFGMLLAVVRQCRAERRDRGRTTLRTVCTHFFSFAFMTPFYLSGIMVPLYSGPLSLGVAYIPILAATIYAVNFKLSTFLEAADRRSSREPKNLSNQNAPASSTDNVMIAIEVGEDVMGDEIDENWSFNKEYRRLLFNLRNAKTSEGVEDGLDKMREYVLKNLRIVESDVVNIAQQLRQHNCQHARAPEIPRYATAVHVGDYIGTGNRNHMWTEGVNEKFLNFLMCVSSSSS